jgi:hypothetical protein
LSIVWAKIDNLCVIFNRPDLPEIFDWTFFQ